MPNEKQTILITEDEKSSVFLYTEELAEAGYRIVTAENGYQALGMLEDEPVALLMTDIQMPDMDAFELIPQVRAQFPGLPIIVVSAFKDREKVMDDLHFRINGFFTKPVDMVELKKKIAELIAPVAGQA
jgi:response regulator RpfG family c-di-GMP phosphodiesterase